MHLGKIYYLAIAMITLLNEAPPEFHGIKQCTWISCEAVGVWGITLPVQAWLARLQAVGWVLGHPYFLHHL